MKTLKSSLFLSFCALFLFSCASKSKSQSDANISIWDGSGEPVRVEATRSRTSTRTAAPQFDIPVVRNAEVEMWMNYFQGRGRRWFQIWLERSGAYIPMMRSILREHGQPEDLVYLAMIESGFSARAYSRARAVGHWQFMQATGRLYGLRVNFWVDERRDPEKATEAAARHLRDLYERFGDWKLAAAAYNAGAGRISRAIRFHGTEDYWVMARGRHLAAETRNYVPKLIAAAVIAKNPEAFGFTNIQYQEPISFERIVIKKPVDLRILSQRAGYKYEDIQYLNPELNYHVTPPYEERYELRVPVKSSMAFMAAYQQLGPQEFFKYAHHRVQRGETISSIAARYRIPQGEIMNMNRITNARHLQIGQNLILPIPEGADFQVRSSPQRASRPVAVAPGELYLVRRGDSLWSISQAHNTSIQALRGANNLRGNTIRIGQRLRIPGGSNQTQASGQTASKPVAASKNFHVVQRGESLWTISQRYNLTVDQLRRSNQLRSDALAVGQRLNLPEGAQMGKAQTDIIHVVRRGDTLWSISQRYGRSIQSIKQSNNMNRSTIHPGKRLIIPANEA